MAYHDASGKIMIDENAANRDINKLNEAIKELEQMKERIMILQRSTSSFSGRYAQAILDRSNILNKQISTNIDELNYVISSIRITVKKYRELDQKLKNTIMNS